MACAAPAVPPPIDLCIPGPGFRHGFTRDRSRSRTSGPDACETGGKAFSVALRSMPVSRARDIRPNTLHHGAGKLADRRWLLTSGYVRGHVLDSVWSAVTFAGNIRACHDLHVAATTGRWSPCQGPPFRIPTCRRFLRWFIPGRPTTTTLRGSTAARQRGLTG